MIKLHVANAGSPWHAEVEGLSGLTLCVFASQTHILYKPGK